MPARLRFAPALALLACLLSLPGPAAAQDGGRTYYDRLRLDTPEAAARTFLDAYAAADYATVYLVLSNRTQTLFLQAVNAFDFEPLLKSDQPIGSDLYTVLIPNLAGWEQTQDMAWLFDHVMLVARDRHILPLIIEPGAITGRPEGSPPQIVAQTSGGPLVITLVQSPSRRWRVDSAIPSGRAPDRLPWGLP